MLRVDPGRGPGGHVPPPPPTYCYDTEILTIEILVVFGGAFPNDLCISLTIAT